MFAWLTRRIVVRRAIRDNDLVDWVEMSRGFAKVVLSLAPWIAFLVIAQRGLLRLKIGLVVALLLSVVLSVAGLHRGIIMWAGLVFFVGAMIAVLEFENAWTIRHMGVLASGALAVGS